VSGCFNFAEVCADACVATGFEGVGDGEERVAISLLQLIASTNLFYYVVFSRCRCLKTM
jgi:hypothetical protein